MATSPRRRAIVRSLLLACVLIAAISRIAKADSEHTHVRPTDPAAAALFAEGSASSPALRALVDHLAQSNLVVYIELSRLPQRLMGRLTLIGSAAGWRYVRVQIDCGQSRLAQLTALGHEIRHAVEIADAPDVVDQASVENLYRRIGYVIDDRTRRFESGAAQRAGLLVRHEIIMRAERLAP